MTVKIKDKKLFDKYLKAKQETATANEGDDIVFVAYCFLSHVSDDNPIKEVQTVVNAIFNSEEVKLFQQKYMVPLPHLIFDGDQIYLAKSNISKEIMTDWNPFNPDIQSKLTLDEIPEEYRKWAKKVEDK